MRVINVEGVRGSALRSAVRSIYAREVGGCARCVCSLLHSAVCCPSMIRGEITTGPDHDPCRWLHCVMLQVALNWRNIEEVVLLSTTCQGSVRSLLWLCSDVSACRSTQQTVCDGYLADSGPC
jgi:hypothetical protein